MESESEEHCKVCGKEKLNLNKVNQERHKLACESKQKVRDTKAEANLICTQFCQALDKNFRLRLGRLGILEYFFNGKNEVVPGAT